MPLPDVTLRARLSAAALGLAGVGFLPFLPSPLWLLPAPILLGWLYRRHRGAACLVGAWLAGTAWALLFAHWQVWHALPAEWADRDITVQGRLVGLPDRDARRTRAVLAVERVLSTDGEALPVAPRRLRVSWYGGPRWRAGERWQLRVRVKPPRGFVNPGGFDYQRWLLRQEIDATGYVRPDAGNRRLAPPGPLSLSHHRAALKQWLAERAPPAQRDLLAALLLGDRSGLTPERWALLRSTGTQHLLAISGLHVGFVALLGYVLGCVAGRLLNGLVRRCPAAVAGHLLAFTLALLYSALAGFSIPTQRALVMVLVVQWSLWRRRSVRPADSLLCALLAVLWLDPLAVFDRGFWLSFSAVAVLLFAFVGRGETRRALPGGSLVRSQWVVFLGLMVPCLMAVNAVSLLAPVANLVAIPLVTFLVVPWLLGAAVLAPSFPGVGDAGLAVAAEGLAWLIAWLEALDQLRPWTLIRARFSLPALALATVAVALCLLPRGLPGRALGYPALLLAWLLPRPEAPALRVAFLDVGQGLAVAVQTREHQLVYDTGPRYSDRLDAGGGIIVPYWHRLGIDRLDALIISHGHEDHAGGARSLQEVMAPKRLWRGDQPESAEPAAGDCHQGASWEWDGVHFRFLHSGWPESPSRNNRSCVLLIRYRDQTLLLTGDIEREVEWRLVGGGQLPASVDVLQVPHHGAAGSSTAEWVSQTRPELAVVSAAYRGRHRHPAAEVVDRYQGQGSRVWNTAEAGAVVLEWDGEGRLSAHQWRQHRRRWWYAGPDE